MKTFLKIMGVLFVLGAIAVVGLVLLIGSVANEAGKAIAEEEKNDTPTLVIQGDAFTHDKYDVAKGWKVKSDDMGYLEIRNVVVTNTGDTADTPMFTFDLESLDGAEVLASVDCLSNEIGPGQRAKLDNCLSSDKLPKGKFQVTVRDTW